MPDPPLVAVNRAVIATLARTLGFHRHVAVYGPLPDVAMFRHVPIALLLAKKVTLPADERVNTKVVAVR